MADHLPECPMNDLDHLGRPLVGACICDQLRQAEQRGMLMQSAVEVDTAVINQNRSYAKGYAAALTAARNAVAALAYSPCPKDEEPWADIDEAVTAILAAIDALRGES